MPGLLVRLATTRAIDGLRQRARVRKQQMSALEWQESPAGAASSDETERAELIGRLREAIAQLPEQEASVFCLRHLNEMSYRQIARELNMRVNTVGVSLHRAKARLREALGRIRIEEDEVPNGTR
jgi:RNA polymerase sigma-70 factor (ECF subfamily)